MKLKLPGRTGSAGILAALCAIALALTLSACSSTGTDDPAAPVDPVKSAVCTLSALTVSSGTLTPAFDPAVTSYAVDVESNVKSITVTGTAADAKATVSESGAAARTLALGSTTIALTVTAENGTAKAYTVTAFRKPVVYVAGQYYDGSGGLVACYWKGSTRVNLSVPAGVTQSCAEKICLVDDSIYIAGYYKNSGYYNPCYWKDGVRTDLATGGVAGMGYGLAVANGSVYVAGYYMAASNNNRYTPCYWADGTLVELEHVDDLPASANSIVVSGGDVYVGGQYGPDDTRYLPCYWKGSVKYDLPIPSDQQDGCTYEIAVVNGSVYVCGMYSYGNASPYKTGAWWKDGVRTAVTVDGAEKCPVTNIVVDGNAVFLAGYWQKDFSSPKNSCLWRGTERTDVFQGIGKINSLAALDSRLYYTGFKSNGLSDPDEEAVAFFGENTTLHNIETSVDSQGFFIALGEE